MKGKLKNKLEYPTYVFEKMNGYLGMVGVNNGELYIASKSSCDNNQSKWLREMIETNYSEEVLKRLSAYLEERNVTMIFEVIKPKDDPHIINYKEDNLVLLNIVYNEIEFSTVDWEEVEEKAKEFGFELPKLYTVLNSWEEFKEFYMKALDENPLEIDGEYIEGYVLKSSNNFMVKLKLPFYNYWKEIRDSIFHGLINKEKGFRVHRYKKDSLEEALVLRGMEIVEQVLDEPFNIIKFRESAEIRKLILDLGKEAKPFYSEQ